MRIYHGKLGFHFPDGFKLALRSIGAIVTSFIPGTNEPLEVALHPRFLLVGIDIPP
jgi:hypothetical protein